MVHIVGRRLERRHAGSDHTWRSNRRRVAEYFVLAQSVLWSTTGFLWTGFMKIRGTQRCGTFPAIRKLLRTTWGVRTCASARAILLRSVLCVVRMIACYIRRTLVRGTASRWLLGRGRVTCAKHQPGTAHG